MSEKYEAQLAIEKLNKEIIQNIIDNVGGEKFIEFYTYHNQKETMAEFGIRTTKQLVKILKIFNYDFSKQKPSKYKGKTAARSHESYVAGGRKSGETQKQHWEEKSDLEKALWSKKQKEAHSTDEFRAKIKQINIDYQASLAPEQKAEIKAKKSKTAKNKWAQLTIEEQELIMGNRFKSGRTYHVKDSGPNRDFAAKLDQAGLIYEREFCIDRKLYDFKINNILIEINPAATHNTTKTLFKYNKPLDKYYHRDKSTLAANNGFRCIHVFDWDDKNKIIKLVKNDRETLYGRDCIVREIPASLAKPFIEANHLQKYVKDMVRIGLFNNETLVAIMTFGIPRYNKNYEWELLRYCASKNIIGGADKLFKYFVDNYAPSSVISYCDLGKFSGKTYEKLNFKLKSTPVPSKHWYNINTKEHFTDALLRQQGFSRLVHHCDAKEDVGLITNNNRELMIDAGFVEIYDCGQATYIWDNR